MIALTPCKSKMLEAYGYEASSQTLAVRFGPGKIYHYQNVPSEVYGELCKAESVGITFSKLIRGQFEHEVILDDAETIEPSDA